MVLPDTKHNTTYDPVLSEAPWFVKTQYACVGCVVTGCGMSGMECGGKAQQRHRFGSWQWRMPETRAAASRRKRRRCRRTPKMVMVRVGAVIYGVRWQSAAATPLWLAGMADAGSQGRRVRGKAASLPPRFKNGSGGACYMGGGARLCDNTDKFRGSRPAAFRQFQGEQTWRRKT